MNEIYIYDALLLTVLILAVGGLAWWWAKDFERRQDQRSYPEDP